MDEKLGLKDAADILAGLRSEQVTVWNIFLVVSIGIIGLVYSQDVPKDATFKAIITFAFVVFASGNLRWILWNQEVMVSLADRLSNVSDTSTAQVFGILRDRFRHTKAAVLYHLAGDVAVAAAIWMQR